jgi:hypothetical protein
MALKEPYVNNPRRQPGAIATLPSCALQEHNVKKEGDILTLN